MSDEAAQPQDEPRLYMTDVGNSQELARQHGGALRYVGPYGKWLVWDKVRWSADQTGQVVRRAKRVIRNMLKDAAAIENDGVRAQVIKHALASESARGIDAMIKLAQSEPGIPILPDDLDADDMMIGAPNGAVDLRTGELHKPDPKRLITKLVGAHYDPAAQSLLWQKFLYRVLADNEEMIRYLQRLAGYWLTGSIKVQEFWIFWGDGNNGKGVFFDTLNHVFGDYAGVAPESLLTTKSREEHPTEIADVEGKRLLIGSETEAGAQLRIQLIKRMTGDATLKARRMRQDYFEFRRTHKMALQTNNKPLIRENTHAVWRRLRLVPFIVTIPEKERDESLIDKLKDEASGILTWAVQGCLGWQRDGLQTPAEVRIATQNYQAESDPLADFLAERCVRGDENIHVSRVHMHEQYQSWCTSIGDRHPMDRNILYEQIRRVKGVTEGSWRENGAAVRGFKGIGLRAVYEPV